MNGRSEECAVLQLGTEADLDELTSSGQMLVPQEFLKSPYRFERQTPRRAQPGHVLIYSQRRTKRFVYIGVLHDARVTYERQELHFKRYEPFTHPVVAYDEDLGIKLPYAGSRNQGYGPTFDYRDSDYARMIMGLGRIPGETASTFAQGMAEHFENNQEVSGVVGKVSDGDILPHEAFHPFVKEFLEAFLKRKGIADLHALVDYEGLGSRNIPQRRNYRLLGTNAYPDAAVLSPFRCAIEYDRQTNLRNWSRLKTSLGKTSAHVLSGAYEAAVQVYVLRSDGEQETSDYREDRGWTTRNLLQAMKSQGVHLAILRNRGK